jgi:hypothetical protein
VLDYEQDIESDLSAFHRIDDPSQMTSARYFMLAERLAAYKGALRARIELEAHERESSNDIDDEDNLRAANAIAAKLQTPNQAQQPQTGLLAQMQDPAFLAKARERATI